MNIGFTGTQNGMGLLQKRIFCSIINHLREINKSLVFAHGDCIGADAEAHKIIQAMGIPIVIHPPLDSKKRAYSPLNSIDTILPFKEYIARNHDIVDASDFMIGIPRLKFEEQRSGTWATIRYSRKITKDCCIIYPDGFLGK